VVLRVRAIHVARKSLVPEKLLDFSLVALAPTGNRMEI
jgi:hypothetical protein